MSSTLIPITQFLATSLSITLFLAPLGDFIQFTSPKAPFPQRYLSVIRGEGDDSDNDSPLPSQIPYFCMLLSTLLWLSYGIIRYDLTVLSVNVFGCVMAVFYLRRCYNMMMHRVRKETQSGTLPSQQVAAVLETRSRLFLTKCAIPVLLWLFALAFCFLWDADIESKLGTICVTASIILFASPLAELRHILRSRNASSISMALTTAQIANCLSWVAYGLLIGDIYVMMPNVIGVILGALALVVKRNVEGGPRKGGILP